MIYGYMGKILRVNLSDRKSDIEELPEKIYEKYLGGVSLGAKLLLEEVQPGTNWFSPENRMILMAGPLSGTRVSGSGTFCALSKGPMTEMGGASQANGFLGAYLRFSGYDGLLIQGKASSPVYLYIHENGVEFKDASRLTGKGTSETQQAIKKELSINQKLSVFAIGPAGENLVRFAGIVGDGGHVAGHNGMGAVWGSKNLKAIAVHFGSKRPLVHDEEKFRNMARELLNHAKNFADARLYKYGTMGIFKPHLKLGQVPVKNYTTNILKNHDRLLPEYTRSHFDIKSKPCWACGIRHVKQVRVTEGPYMDLEGEEPEYECVNAWGPLVGNMDPGAVVMLSNVTDDLGMDTNEAGWTIAWVMECFEKGYLTGNDTDGLKMNWGNVEEIRKMLEKIARREGFGDTLAEGAKRASTSIGGEAAKLAVYTHKGNTPRGHDHRARWNELLDTCLSDTGTIESTMGPLRGDIFDLLGKPKVKDQFSPEEVPRSVALVGGWYQFEDCLGVCRFCMRDPNLIFETIKAATGREIDVNSALSIGKMAINQLRIFNIRHGLRRELERPSDRYGSAPVDGPAQGKRILSVWDEMVNNYYTHMGWDPSTGKPLPETLKSLGLEHLVQY
jgi:aldehyde:ferredoxin oxidoreductase